MVTFKCSLSCLWTHVCLLATRWCHHQAVSCRVSDSEMNRMQQPRPAPSQPASESTRQSSHATKVHSKCRRSLNTTQNIATTTSPPFFGTLWPISVTNTLKWLVGSLPFHKSNDRIRLKQNCQIVFIGKKYCIVFFFFSFIFAFVQFLACEFSTYTEPAWVRAPETTVIPPFLTNSG